MKVDRMPSAPPPASPVTHPKPWEEKNPWIAGTLAYLIPGAGHLYQGRTVKGLIYFCSILGLFFWGQKLGEGMVVYNVPETRGVLRNVTLSFAAQFGAGAAALPSLIQNRRARHPSNVTIRRLQGPFSSSFEGQLNPQDDSSNGQLVGTLRLEPVETGAGLDVKGTFEGTLDGQPTKLDLASRFEMERPVKAGYRRTLQCGVESDPKEGTPRWIAGTIPRSIVDAYGSPPEPEQLQEINGRLGKLYELALVFTWIAGLLNILAIWDCVLGPAYGFGDEQLSAKESETASGSADAGSSAAKTATGTAEEAPRPEGRPIQKSPV